MTKYFILCSDCTDSMNAGDWRQLETRQDGWYDPGDPDHVRELAQWLAGCHASIAVMGDADVLEDDETSGAYDCWVCSEVTYSPTTWTNEHNEKGNE